MTINHIEKVRGALAAAEALVELLDGIQVHWTYFSGLITEAKEIRDRVRQELARLERDRLDALKHR
jgi:hypothetical protein